MAKEPIITQYEPYPGIRPELVNVLRGSVFSAHDVLAGALHLASMGVVRLQIEDKEEPLSVQEEVLLQKKLAPVQNKIVMFIRTHKTGQLMDAIRGKENPLGTAIILGGDAARNELIQLGLMKYHISGVLVAGAIFTITYFLGGLLWGESGFAASLLLIPILIVIAYIFSWKPTEEGMRALAHMDGFERFIVTVEKDRSKLDAYVKSHDLYEATAYMVAFKHDKTWSKALKDYNNSII